MVYVLMSDAVEKRNFFLILGMTKIKMSKEDQGSGEFVEKRRAALER